MAQRSKLVRSLYKAWNDRDFDKSTAFMHDDGEMMIVGSGERFVGPQGVRQIDSMWATAFPDGKITIDRMIEAGDCVVCEFTGRGTHTGPLEGPGGTIPASGRSVTLQICDVIEWDGRKIRSIHEYFDSASLMMQVGAMPASKVETGHMI